MTLKAAEVYIIDDDADAREAVGVLVRTLGLVVKEYDSAENFLQNYAGHRPACIVADMRMLGMSGLELLKELRRRGLSVPVIILTAHADTPTTVQAMKSGAFTTLDKPCRNSELWDTIRVALHDDIRRGEEDRRRQQVQERLDSLTPAEREVLKHLVAGDPNKMIAHRLDVGLRTVEARRKSLSQKMEVDSIAELVKQVMLVDPTLTPPLPSEGS